MQTRTGARSNLKGLLQENKITAMLEKKLETKELENALDKKTKLYKTRKEIWKHEKTQELPRRRLRG